MLTSEEFRDWCIELDLNEQTIQEISQIRSSPPSRRVQSPRGNVSGRYPSQKMGMTIQFESHHHELAGIYAMEYDSEVLEYYDQPPSIKLNYESASGHQVGVKHTPDFFEIGRRSATRPGAKPRFGSVCERLFGTANTMFVHNLAGNTQITKNPRSVTNAVNPRHHAVWTLGSLHEHLCNWIYEFYDLQEHPALGLSPEFAYEQSILQTGLRLSRTIPYDETFRILTMPTTNKGTAKVIPNQGVKINHLYYWHNSFRNGSIEKTTVSVKYDPKDAGVAYAYVRKQWVRCISQYYSVFKGRSEREIQLATQELRQQYKQHSKRFTITAKALAVFLEGTEITESILMQRLKDGEVNDADKCEPINEQNTRTLVDVEEEKSPSISSEIKPYEEFW